jgi:hypothetical protein
MFILRAGSAFVRNDAKVFRFCTSKYVLPLMPGSVLITFKMSQELQVR